MCTSRKVCSSRALIVCTEPSPIWRSSTLIISFMAGHPGEQIAPQDVQPTEHRDCVVPRIAYNFHQGVVMTSFSTQGKSQHMTDRIFRRVAPISVDIQVPQTQACAASLRDGSIFVLMLRGGSLYRAVVLSIIYWILFYVLLKNQIGII